MGPETPIRVAGPADAATVAGLLIAFRDFLLSSEPAEADVLPAVERLIADPRTEFLLVGEPARGFAQLRFRYSVWAGADDAWIEDVYVAEEARGRGYGTVLVKACCERARARGCRRVELEANRANRAGVALYRSQGFTSSHHPDMWGAESDDLFFSREL